MTSTPGPRRATRQRSAVSALMVGLDEFHTAQEVHDLLRHQGESVGLATVYRNLQAMADDGELDVVRTPDGQSAYRHCAGHHHHHLICRACGHTVEVEFPNFEETVARVAAEHGFTAVDHEVELFGLCADHAGTDVAAGGRAPGDAQR
ncbi:Fur family transcriptional regulator [Nigerium massiliense]|uniref:Fur family transcriptional regulator n=1 Tax=Nigerium massiliense TaxID=1522317 RepID=UPI00058ABEE4|nr:transcriptional repressor [Nigerium massiliense]